MYTHQFDCAYRFSPDPFTVPVFGRRLQAEIEKNDFNLNISRYISTAVGEDEIDLVENHGKLLEIEQAIREATSKHNAFLKELGLPLLP